MNEVQIFDNEEFGNVRTLMIDEDPWFVGKDIATALGYGNTRQAIASNVDDEDKGVHSVDTPSGAQNMVIINESGLYCLILSSKLPTAKKFKRWVTSEVLPALRKNGSYTMSGAEKKSLTTDDYIKAAEIIAKCETDRLPMVLKMLSKAGLDVATEKPPVVPIEPIRQIVTEQQKIQPVRPIKREVVSDIELMKLQLVLSRYEPKKVARLMGVDVSVIYSYRAGKRHPYRERYDELMDFLDPKHEIVEEH